jgi:hypothetical protein
MKQTYDSAPSIIVTCRGQDWAEVQLTQGRWAKVDIADIPLVAGRRWRFGAGYAYRTQGKSVILMHREILRLPPGDPRFTDHINHDGTDNRRTNIRPCSRSENMANAYLSRKSSSRFRGVYWEPNKQTWHAHITIQCVHHDLGRFEVEEEAALAYRRAAIEAWGDFIFLDDVRQST